MHLLFIVLCVYVCVQMVRTTGLKVLHGMFTSIAGPQGLNSDLCAQLVSVCQSSLVMSVQNLLRRLTCSFTSDVVATVPCTVKNSHIVHLYTCPCTTTGSLCLPTQLNWCSVTASMAHSTAECVHKTIQLDPWPLCCQPPPSVCDLCTMSPLKQGHCQSSSCFCDGGKCYHPYISMYIIIVSNCGLSPIESYLMIML